jgi:AraC-like DNA-binding protein
VNYNLIPPCEELKGLVHHFWSGTWDEPTSKPQQAYYIIASSLTEITFGFNSYQPQADLQFAMVQGHTNLPNRFDVPGFRHLIGVSFYSHAIPLLFRMPATDLNQEFITLEILLGTDGKILNEKIAAVNSTQGRIKLLSDFLVGISRKQKLEDQLIAGALKEILKFNGRLKVDELARDFSLSQKQFTRRFKEFSGFNPKTYARIIRLESVIRNYSSQTQLTDLAYRHGYYDQAHFNHEFKSFTGFTPTDFWKLGESN